MNDFAKTGAVLGAAVLLTLFAITMKPGEVRLDLYSDQGEEFFPGFTDGEKIAELELTAYRLESSKVYAFGVKRGPKGGWTIPSHGDYPADASEQMGKAAAMMIGLKKQSVVGDRKGNHADYDLIDPLAGGVETAGRGTRVKLKDSAGNVLADLIVGKEVEGKTGTHYVRLPTGKRVYKVELKGSLSTQFTDWIETDLLKAQSSNIAKVTFDNYSIDEVKSVIVPGEKIVLAKGADDKFVLEGIDAAKEQTNEEKANEIGTTLGEIKIVGVRRKPEGLTARLERANSRDAQLLSRYLNPRGYFLAGGGKVVSNDGDLLFETKSGVRYTLRFGKLVFGEGDAITAGIGTDTPKEGDGDDPKKDANNRYLMVSVEFDEALLDKPTAVRLAADELVKRKGARFILRSIQDAIANYTTANEGKLPAALVDLTVKPEEGEALLKDLAVDPWGNPYVFVPAGDTYVLMSHAADGKVGGEGANQDVRSDQIPLEDALAAAATEWTTFDGKVKTGQEEAEGLTKRFGPWYYVIDKALFDKLKPARADLVEPKVEEPKPGDAPK